MPPPMTSSPASWTGQQSDLNDRPGGTHPPGAKLVGFSLFAFVC